MPPWATDPTTAAPAPSPEEDAGAPVLEIDQRGHRVGGDEQGALGDPGADEGLTHGHTVEETAAGCIDVEGWDAVETQAALDQAGCGGEERVGGHGGDHQDVDPRVPRALQGAAGRRRPHLRGGLACRRPVAEPDPGPLHDPGIGGVHHRLELGVGQDALGKAGADGKDAGAAFASGCRGSRQGGGEGRHLHAQKRGPATMVTVARAPAASLLEACDDGRASW